MYQTFTIVRISLSSKVLTITKTKFINVLTFLWLTRNGGLIGGVSSHWGLIGGVPSHWRLIGGVSSHWGLIGGVWWGVAPALKDVFIKLFFLFIRLKIIAGKLHGYVFLTSAPQSLKKINFQ